LEIYIANFTVAGEWKGDWSFLSSRWTPLLRRQLGVVEGTGVFFMSFEDFCDYFTQVDVCQLRKKWVDVRQPWTTHSTEVSCMHVHNQFYISLSFSLSLSLFCFKLLNEKQIMTMHQMATVPVFKIQSAALTRPIQLSIVQPNRRRQRAHSIQRLDSDYIPVVIQVH
jgi:hypothetical protein